MRHIRPVQPLALTAALALAVGGVLAVPGCASRYGAQQTAVQYYPGCYQPIADLRNSEHSVLKSTAGGAALGALAGALLGALSSDRHRRGGNVAAGAITGGIAGGMMGSVYAQKQQIADENRRMASYLEDLEGDISGLDIVSASARTSLQCYDRQFQNLVGHIRAKQVSRGQAERMFSEIKSGREEAIAILGQAETRGRELDRQYQEAFYQEERALEQPRQTVARAEQPARAQQQARPRTQAQKKQSKDAIAAGRKQQQNLNRKVDQIAQERKVAQAKNQADSQAVAKMLAEIDA